MRFDMWIDILVGFVTGIISGFGIGGGTLLMLWLWLASGADQFQAAGINLVYFISCAVFAVIGHIKNRFIDKKAFFLCAVAGIPTTLISSLCAAALDVVLLRRLFGVLLLFIGFKELFHKKKECKERDE